MITKLEGNLVIRKKCKTVYNSHHYLVMSHVPFQHRRISVCGTARVCWVRSQASWAGCVKSQLGCFGPWVSSQSSHRIPMDLTLKSMLWPSMACKSSIGLTIRNFELDSSWGVSIFLPGTLWMFGTLVRHWFYPMKNRSGSTPIQSLSGSPGVSKIPCVPSPRHGLWSFGSDFCSQHWYDMKNPRYSDTTIIGI